MHIHTIIRYCLLSLLCLPDILCAQTANPEAHVSIQFQAITWKHALNEVFFQSAAGEEMELKAYSHIRSAHYTYEGPATLQFYKKVSTADGQVIKAPIAAVQIQPEASHLLLIFAKTTTDQYQIIPLPDDLHAFPYGSFKFFNLTTHPIIAQIQDERIQLEPKKQLLKRIASRQNSSNLKVKIAMGDAEGWNIFYTNSWGHNERRRTLVLIFEEDAGRYKVKRFREEQKNK
jgi:hypothetical protein